MLHQKALDWDDSIRDDPQKYLDIIIKNDIAIMDADVWTFEISDRATGDVLNLPEIFFGYDRNKSLIMEKIENSLKEIIDARENISPSL